ncbi:ectonucleoside triphosphate diphosphohydrolase 5 isoform X2 [Bacillus rossius redtenbacheri]|uniref:ectonucleoside triphosphate diphosphohydrolase 5 isoform X2 n=1 Tax=Bacillus rossius redtenbacheri TaxID=93214 RepID=UPI002FDC7ECC
MSSIRKRKLIDDRQSFSHQRTNANRPQSRSPKIRLQKWFLILISFVALTLVVGSYYKALPWSLQSHATNTLDAVAYSLGLQKHVHAIIIDAGSTGSRVLAFTFHESLLDGTLRLDNELFVQIKPGLSSYADNPKKGAEKLQELLDRAKEVIPHSDWGRTPLAMKATAGLRLLPDHQADSLLDEVRKLFSTSPFLTNVNSVAIMDGVDEGLFSWFTVNFLLDRLGGEVKKTVAALDLGGGSTQITFAPSEAVTLKQADPKFLHPISLFHHNVTVYTHSYLGLGLMAARKAILTVGKSEGSTTLRSECVNPIITGAPWTYSGVTYTVRGPEKPEYKTVKGSAHTEDEKRPVVRFTECVNIIQKYVKGKVDKPAELNSREINAFSYYFDRATEFGLIDPFTGGVVTVKDFQKAAIRACETPNTEQPFMCLDLAFISVLLKDGFGLNPDVKLNLYKKIDGHEISWALGAAFHILQNGL